jgi:hypothetical protein
MLHTCVPLGFYEAPACEGQLEDEVLMVVLVVMMLVVVTLT